MRKIQIRATMRYHHTLTRIAKIEEKLKMQHIDEDTEQLELSHIADGNAI